mmetsp:Transcript_148270/g.256890  ORF Transcript_148270/g.256890 Transcript_148270/m.256890 type:complete len:105 (+) Transcript_148270:1-315(+)
MADAFAAPAVSKPGPVMMAAEAPPANEDIVQFGQGVLSNAPVQMIRDFENDMGHLSAAVGAQVVAEIQRDRLVVRGGVSERAAAQEELRKVCSFYNLRAEHWSA